MFVDSDRRWLLTTTDDQFVDRCTIYWQLTVWFWNDDSHCEIRGNRPVDICYYEVGSRISTTRCLVPSTEFCCWTCFLNSGFNRYLRQTVESICAFCHVHGQRVKPFETRIDAQSLLYIRHILNPLDARSRYTGKTVYQRNRQNTVYRKHSYQRNRLESGIPDARF